VDDGYTVLGEGSINGISGLVVVGVGVGVSSCSSWE